MPRKSKRLSKAKKKAEKQKKQRRSNRRVSVADALGLTPHKPKGTNLSEAKALEAAAAAARKLDTHTGVTRASNDEEERHRRWPRAAPHELLREWANQ